MSGNLRGSIAVARAESTEAARVLATLESGRGNLSAEAYAAACAYWRGRRDGAAEVAESLASIARDLGFLAMGE